MIPNIDDLIFEKTDNDTLMIRFGLASIAMRKTGEIFIGNGDSMIALNEHVCIEAKKNIYLNCD